MRPKIFGAVLNAMVEYLRKKSSVNAPELPRMADFAVRVISAETTLGWEKGEFLPYYIQLLEGAARDASEGDMCIEAIREFMHGKPEWEGTATELRQEISGRIEIGKEKFLPAANKLPVERWKPILALHLIDIEQKRKSEARKIILINRNPSLNCKPPERKPREIRDALQKKL